MKFEKGQSGNPAGRLPGTRNRATMLQEMLDDGGAAIAAKAMELAQAGNIAAIKLCLERLVPLRRNLGCELPQLNGAGDSVAAVGSILDAVGQGTLAPRDAADLGKVVEVYMRALAATWHEQRLAELERVAGGARAPQTLCEGPEQ